MVSIIIPVYNVEKYLRNCIDSVINQVYSDYEVILVNDGSTDNSLAICKEYGSKYSKIKCIEQENKGLASARNTGIKAASGEYIFFLDSDDCLNKNLLEIAVGVAEKENANMVQIGYEDVADDFDINGCVKEYTLDDAYNNLTRFTVKEALYNLEKSKTKKEQVLNLRSVVVWTKLYRKSAFESLLFPEGMRLHEDQMVAHRNVIMAGEVIYINLPLYYYRRNTGSLIRVGWTRKRLSMLDCYTDRLKWLSELSDETIWKHELIDFVYNRSLVCIFRNYEMAAKTLEKEEKKEVCNFLKGKMRQSLKNKTGRLSFSKKVFFNLFSICPMPFVYVYWFRNKLKK